MTAAEIISRNVRRLRRARGWTQAEAAQKLSAITGQLLSNVSWSAAERSPETGRPKSWTANEIAALAELFDVPVGDLFEPQPPCRVCGEKPPVGFTCNACGMGGAR
ncbi:helix-turn-helix domain-containing protein [Streptomyces acidiscabies]|uniref:helix-turn-helix domain-containing protein n=1 Tax=Streptomyces acidiscabies TaxID=42234 RepID=UPI000952A375|nr:helix-turn-helix domain-containing protein [Streptomyces acidiscabies]